MHLSVTYRAGRPVQLTQLMLQAKELILVAVFLYGFSRSHYGHWCAAVLTGPLELETIVQVSRPVGSTLSSSCLVCLMLLGQICMLQTVTFQTV